MRFVKTTKPHKSLTSSHKKRCPNQQTQPFYSMLRSISIHIAQYLAFNKIHDTYALLN